MPVQDWQWVQAATLCGDRYYKGLEWRDVCGLGCHQNLLFHHHKLEWYSHLYNHQCHHHLHHHHKLLQSLELSLHKKYSYFYKNQYLFGYRHHKFH